eukprot:gnl/Dysnectes_brevis/512_a568_5810.p1 GENE.gnl/Dysnectes_brevis/512_a568_5810~~gnl/Dysnectes_brevis/512_a568_5810.p1  ORF type:complete len:186 (-),score=49.53 gnl/Dysnectes_brevis/512_a568_5810:107-664(-)
MGQEQSKTQTLSEDKLKELTERTYFTEEEIQKFYEHFSEICSTEKADNLVDYKEFLAALSLKESLFSRRMFDMIDEDGNEQIEFEELVNGLSVFSAQAPQKEKIDFTFRLYDLDGNGNLDRQELEQLLTASLDTNPDITLSAEQISALLDQVFEEVDTDGNGVIDKPEFVAMCEANPLLISHLKL